MDFAVRSFLWAKSVPYRSMVIVTDIVIVRVLVRVTVMVSIARIAN